MALDDEDDDGVREQFPLKGVVLCCTSLPQEVRSQVEDVVKPMGAHHKPDLTSDVTHLLVGALDTPKYRYVAAERPDIAVLHPSWIEALRAAWTSGGVVDVAAITKAHRLPTFHELQICVTGFVDPDERALVSGYIEQNGGVYHGDLTKAVSHLVAAEPRGPKYNAAKQWGIKIVGVKWLTDCLRRGMVVSEALYDPVLPVEEQGKNAWRKEVPAVRLGKRGRGVANEAGGELDGGKRKLRRTLSSKLHGQSQDMWMDFSAREFTAAKPQTDKWRDDNPAEDRAMAEEASGMKNGGTTTPLDDLSEHTAKPDKALPSQTSESLFTGRHVLIHGFEQSKAARLRSFLEPNGAIIATSSHDLDDASANDPLFRARYLLVPHALPTSSSLTTLPDIPPGTPIVTEWWLERCIHFKNLFDPYTDPLSRPFWKFDSAHKEGPGRVKRTTVSGFESLSISTTGFGGVDVRQIAEAVKLMGGKYQEVVSPESSVMLCGGGGTIKKEKAFYARKHGIPVVGIEWLWICLEKGFTVGYEPCRVALPDVYPAAFGGDGNNSNPASAAGSRPGSAGVAAAGKTSRTGAAHDSNRKESSSHSKRLSNSRRKHATPSLALQASKPEFVSVNTSTAADGVSEEHARITSDKQESLKPSGTRARSIPFVHEDDDDEEGDQNDLSGDDSAPLVDDSTISAPGAVTKESNSHRRSQPLTELSPNLSPRKIKDSNLSSHKIESIPKDGSLGKTSANSNSLNPRPSNSPSKPAPTSPRRPSTSDDPSKQPALPAAQPTLRNPSSNLAADLRSLLNQATSSSRPGSAGTATSTSTISSAHPTSVGAGAVALPLPRKKRPLGRNISGNGLSNLSRDASVPASRLANETEDVNFREEEHGGESALPMPLPVPLGTQLSYASPESDAHRVRMGKVMGVKFSSDGEGDSETDDQDEPNEVYDQRRGAGPAGPGGRSNLREVKEAMEAKKGKSASNSNKRVEVKSLGVVKDSETLSASAGGGGRAGGGVAGRVRNRLARAR